MTEVEFFLQPSLCDELISFCKKKLNDAVKFNKRLILDLTNISLEEYNNFCNNYSIGNGQELLEFIESHDEDTLQEVLSELWINTPSLNY